MSFANILTPISPMNVVTLHSRGLHSVYIDMLMHRMTDFV